MNRIAAIAFASVLASTAQADQNSAFQDAKSFAGGKTQGVFTGISSGTVADKIPGYGANPSETQFFQGGQGALSGPGVTKMQNCASYTPGQNKIANQECEAVNFLARNPEVRPQFNIGSNDPIVISAKEARKNAESYFQSLDINDGTEGSTQCTTKTTTTPAQYTTETCTSLRAIEGQQCTMGRKVDIDADANYQCDKTLTAFTSQERQPVVSTSSCTYGRQVNIDADSNFQCDKTLTAFTSQERQPTVSTSSCSYGRQVNIDADSNFQCDKTTHAYESIVCSESVVVSSVTPGISTYAPKPLGTSLGQLSLFIYAPSYCRGYSSNYLFFDLYVYASGNNNSVLLSRSSTYVPVMHNIVFDAFFDPNLIIGPPNSYPLNTFRFGLLSLDTSGTIATTSLIPPTGTKSCSITANIKMTCSTPGVVSNCGIKVYNGTDIGGNGVDGIKNFAIKYGVTSVQQSVTQPSAEVTYSDECALLKSRL